MPKHRVHYTVLLAATLVAMVFGGAALAETDDQLRGALVGSWIVPRDSKDFSSFNAHAYELYRADGTYTTWFYSEDCVEKQRVDLHWSIKNGVLTTIVDATGYTMTDRIIAHDKTRMTFLSLDDGTTYDREKGEICTKVVS